MNWKFWAKKAPAKEPELPPKPDLADPKWDAIAAYFTPGRQFMHLRTPHVVISQTPPWACYKPPDRRGNPGYWSARRGIVATEYLAGVSPESRQWLAHEYDYLLTKIPNAEISE